MYTIGIDMSKNTFHAALDDETVRQFSNTEAGIQRFLGWLGARHIRRRDASIGVEATGVYHLLFADRLTKAGWNVMIINPYLSHRMIGASLRRLKTDRHDALVIRKTLRAGAGYAYTDTLEVLALKTLVTERQALVEMRRMTKQRLHAHAVRAHVVDTPLHDGFSGFLPALSSEIRAMERKITTYAPATQRLLRSIPGIGIASAAALVAIIGDIRRFPSPEKLVAYIGLDCRVHESGTSVRGKGYITKRGNRYLRYILFNAAFIARQRNPELRAYFAKKRSEGKHYLSAMCAVERKLVHLIYAVWKRGTSFEDRTGEREHTRFRGVSG